MYLCVSCTFIRARQFYLSIRTSMSNRSSIWRGDCFSRHNAIVRRIRKPKKGACNEPIKKLLVVTRFQNLCSVVCNGSLLLGSFCTQNLIHSTEGQETTKTLLWGQRSSLKIVTDSLNVRCPSLCAFVFLSFVPDLVTPAGCYICKWKLAGTVWGIWGSSDTIQHDCAVHELRR